MTDPELTARVVALERRVDHLSALLGMLIPFSITPDDLDVEEKAFARRFLLEEATDLRDAAHSGAEDFERLHRQMLLLG